MTMSQTQERPAATGRPWSPPLPRSGEPVGARESTGPGRRVDAVLAVVADRCHRYGPVALRLSLALVFVWFGALKLTGDSPVEGLIGATLPFLSTDVALPALGLVEVLLGLAVALGGAPRVVLLVLAGHLAGTFLSFVTATGFMVSDGNPLLLTADGEFVVKNLVLISAALVLVGREARGPRSRHAAAVS
jgi:uncharacterized membrane protein YphA (DoxX/SURF4 family)